ncbi:MAG TPA: hypothetical protein VET85_11535 [Stellaceae bacterium]|nr:hypothetical protein [Stellaceae bacterium]
MSIDRDSWRTERLRQDGAARMRTGRANRCVSMMAAPEALQIARTLTQKYGPDALSFARDRAARAIEIGDQIALGAWQRVIAATESLLNEPAEN